MAQQKWRKTPDIRLALQAGDLSWIGRPRRLIQVDADYVAGQSGIAAV